MNWRIWRSRTLHPEAAAELMREIETKQHEHEELLDRCKAQIEQKLMREDVPARVHGRVKRAYSVYLKLKRQRITLDQVYDVLAVRIITDSVKNCYAALGVIHNEWHPDAGPDQRLYRHAAAESVSVAAHFCHWAGRHGF